MLTLFALNPPRKAKGRKKSARRRARAKAKKTAVVKKESKSMAMPARGRNGRFLKGGKRRRRSSAKRRRTPRKWTAKKRAKLIRSLVGRARKVRGRRKTYRPTFRRGRRLGLTQKARLIAAGNASPIYGSGGAIRVNAPRKRRRKASRRRRGTSSRRRRAPRRRRAYRSVRRFGRRRLSQSALGKLLRMNPRRRRRKGSRSRRRGRRHARRSNPGGIVGKVMSTVKKSLPYVGGVAAATYGPQLLSRVAPGLLSSIPGGRMGQGAAATLAVSALLWVSGKRGMAKKVAIGGLGWSVGRPLIFKLLRAVGLMKGGNGASAPRQGTAGMGDVISTSELVAGEALLSPNMGDWLTLSGMSGPVSPQLLSGSGMGDWVQFPNQQAAAVATQQAWSPGSIAAATFVPGAENF